MKCIKIKKILIISIVFIYLFKINSLAFTLVIDPGHGGNDSGAIASNGTYERDLNLKIAKYLKEYLSNYKIDVYMSHEGFASGKYELIDRGRFVRSKNADLAISIHLNDSASSNYPNGAEVYVTANTSLPKYNQNSTALANKILNNLSSLGINNRGVHTRLCGDSTDIYTDGTRADYYGIIRYSMRGTKIDYGVVYPTGAIHANVQNGEGIPTVLVEHCFVKGGDIQFINSDQKLKKLAEADGKAIVDYYGLKKKWNFPFKDVKHDAWYCPAIEYTYQNNIIKGYNENTFSPNDKITRAMLVTILYRMENAPVNDGKSNFKDVPKNEWYSKAIKWGEQNKIISGYDSTTFKPNNYLTREQMAVIMKRYAMYKGKNVSAYNNLNSFKDSNQVSSYAKEAMKWAVGAGVINGTDDKRLKPQGRMTRAEAAAIITKYCNNMGR